MREDQTAKVKSLKQQRHEERERRKQHEATNGAKGKQRLIQDDNEDDSYRSDAEEVCVSVGSRAHHVDILTITLLLISSRMVKRAVRRRWNSSELNQQIPTTGRRSTLSLNRYRNHP